VTVRRRRVLLRLLMFAMRMMMRRLMVVMSRCMVVRCGEMVMLLCRMVSHLYLLNLPVSVHWKRMRADCTLPCFKPVDPY
jgi:hypothetical protein